MSDTGRARLTGVHSALGIAPELHLCTDETISPDQACPSNYHPPRICPGHEPFHVSPLAVQSPQIKFLTERGAELMCEKNKTKQNKNRQNQILFSNLLCKGGSRAASWSSGPHLFLTHRLLELFISISVASLPCRLLFPSLFPSLPEEMKNSVPPPALLLPLSNCWQKFLL